MFNLDVIRMKMIIILFILSIFSSTIGQTEWGPWSTCTKSCDFGIQQRQRNTEIETQYCSTQFCDNDIARFCDSSNPCSYRYKCVNSTCHCTLGDGYNIYNCYPQIGNCYIQLNPPTKIGYKFPSDSKYSTYSCTTNDNQKYEVHMIGIYGAASNSYNRNYEITIKSRGLLNKPIIIVLTSYEATNWIINSTVSLDKVLYGGFKKNVCTVTRKAESMCYFKAEKKYSVFGFGSDTGGGDNQEWLDLVFKEFGPITSFTGFYHINTSPVANIVLEVGGNPLQQLPLNHVYNADHNVCDSDRNTTVNCPNDISYNHPYSWTGWSQCSKSCDIGIRSRCKYNNNLQTIETEDEYCNLQYCPDDWGNCSASYDCYYVTGSRSKCENNRCVCTLGSGYNLNNCLPSAGNCTIRSEPETALGYTDINYYFSSQPSMYSCTTNDNNNYELHVVGIYGDRNKNIYQVSLVPHGSISKPIILVLSSYHATHWKINTAVEIFKVVYSGISSYLDQSNVTKASPSACDFEAVKDATLQYGYGTDTGGGRTLQYLTNVFDKYGPLTSFTGYYDLGTDPTSHIIIRVGGSPLQVLYENREYNIPLYECKNGTQSTKTTTEFNATMFEITKHYTTLTSTSTPRLTGTVFMTLPSTKTSTTKLTDAITTPVPTILEYVMVLVLDSGIDSLGDESVLNDKSSTAYQDIYNGLFSFWGSALGRSLRQMDISTITKASTLIINLRIKLSSDTTGDIILVSNKLVNKLTAVIISGNSIGGQSVTITNVQTGQSVFMSLTTTDDLCNYLKTLSQCDTNEECTIVGNIPVCSERQGNNEDNSTTTVIILVTSVVVILVLVILLIILLVRKSRNKQATPNGNNANTIQSDYTFTNQNEVYDEIPAYDPPPYASLRGSTVHQYDSLSKQHLGNNYMDVVA